MDASRILAKALKLTFDFTEVEPKVEMAFIMSPESLQLLRNLFSTSPSKVFGESNGGFMLMNIRVLIDPMMKIGHVQLAGMRLIELQ
jgi:hypothetical protein